MNQLGYISPILYTIEWSVTDKPDSADFVRYFNNVKILRDILPVWSTTPEVPSGVEGFDFHKANDLEQILVDIDLVLTRMAEAWFYSGDLYSGEA
jgi:hypothetical protein